MDAGPLDVEHMLEELCDLHDLIQTLDLTGTRSKKVEVFRVNHITAEDLTVERAKEL